MKLNKNIVIIVIVAVLLLGAIGFYFYKQGKKTVSIQYGAGELPGSQGSQLGASNEEIKKIANALFDDMDGFNWNGHDMEPYKAALLLSDNDIIKLYNAFNIMYQVQSGQTLTGWIENEKFYNNEVTDTLTARLKKLNLK